MKRKIAIRGLAVDNNGQLLAVRQKQYEGSAKIDGYWWCLPGGGLEDSESLLDGLNREMIEETGVKPNIGNLIYIQQFVHNNQEQLEFFFHIKNHQDYHDIDLSKTTHGLKEIEETAFINPKEQKVLPDFLTERDLLSDIKSSSPKIFSYI